MAKGLRIASMHAYRDEHPLGSQLEDGQLGTVVTQTGIGQLRVYLSDGREIYVKGTDLLRFILTYEKFAGAAIADWTEQAKVPQASE